MATRPTGNGPSRGLYEAIVTEALQLTLAELPARYAVDQAVLRPAEAPDRIALHLFRILRRVVAAMAPDARVAEGIRLSRALIDVLAALPGGADVAADAPVLTAQVLRAIAARLPDGTPESFTAPLTPLLDTTLLTNAPGEPRLDAQLAREVPSADRIDVVMAFIRLTGIRPLRHVLRAHCDAGRALRVLTTTYTGSTEAKALDELRELGGDVRVSYDISTTRLHAKSWLFHRASGFSTAYIGSSNLTHSAQVTGLEWNVRVSGARNPDVVDKVAAVFESYWQGGDFSPYEAAEFLARTGAQRSANTLQLSPVEIRLEPFQERLLEKIAVAREQGHHANLLVSATGTGKTVMAAVDYARLRATIPRARLLFVAHREEILTQSRDTFRHALRDGSFGEMWVGDQKSTRFDHVFASVQSLHAGALAHLDPAHFDVVIVDEFHHAGAPTYSALLKHVKPTELLGLTATPERADGLSILDWFGGRIAAELRLWDAIDQHRLTPFAYFGIHDNLDLRAIPWSRGRGYDAEGLSNVYTGNEAWARLVLKQLEAHVGDPMRMQALGFCVSVAHAEFMARMFREAGLGAIAVSAGTPGEARRQALDDLRARTLHVVFSVDLFNEGVDVPAVDTLLLLRPTDSATLFLQQLGRGLRRSHGKSICTVLDFVGQHRREFRFDRKLRALLGGSRQDLITQIETGFPYLPAGCQFELDRVSAEIVLGNVRGAVPSQWRQKVDELRGLGGAVPLAAYLEVTGLELDDVYQSNRSWSELREDAGVALGGQGPKEKQLRAAAGRLLHVDDSLRLDTWRRWLREEAPPAPGTEHDRRLLRMLVASMLGKAATKDLALDEGAALLWAHPGVRQELVELFDVLGTRIDHVHRPLSEHLDVPLRTHAQYTRIEIWAAFGVGEGAKVASWQSGVHYVESTRTDLLAFTLDKTSGDFSPTTRYRDYAISRELVHWESQSLTRAASTTGIRYQRHEAIGTHVLLFARLRTDDRAFSCLGPARYVSHEGEQPMAVTWRLDVPLPGDVFAQYAAAVA